MAEISPDQVGRLLRRAQAAEDAKKAADQAKAGLDQELLDTAREARVGVKELAAVTGLHHNSVRAGIQRAAGETSIDFEQPELEIPDLAGQREGVGISEVISASFPVSADARHAAVEDGPAPRRVDRGQPEVQR